MTLLDGRCYVAWFWNRYIELLKQSDNDAWTGHRFSLWTTAREELQSWTNREVTTRTIEAAMWAEKKLEGTSKARFKRTLSEELKIRQLLLDSLAPKC